VEALQKQLLQKRVSN